MGKNLTVVLKDRQILCELCGVNDKNLRILEGLLGARIYSKGNEILLESDDARTREVFRGVLDQLEDHVRLGRLPEPDLIRAIHGSMVSNDGERLRALQEASVTIPNGLAKVFPKSYTQARYLEALEASDLVFAIGPAGTGKTYLAVAHALRAVLTRRHRKLILTRPVVEAGESLGYLPGDLEQKISPYLRPLYDSMEALVPPEVLRRMEENRVLEIAPLAYMRGRTLMDAYVILDEAQNTTREQMKMFLTRIGEGTRVVVTGDITQVDLPKRQTSGLRHAIPLLKSIDEIQFIFFDETDVVRHELVRKIVRAYEADADGDA
jgi:phosphate starvation-inducible protein PhoH and related proteins